MNDATDLPLTREELSARIHAGWTHTWRGLNLPGFALMEARQRLSRINGEEMAR